MKSLKNYCFIFIFLITSSLVAQTEQRSGWVWINYLGASESFNSMLYINLENEDDIKTHNADWDGKSFTNSAYYAIKLEKWKNNRAKRLRVGTS